MDVAAVAATKRRATRCKVAVIRVAAVLMDAAAATKRRAIRCKVAVTLVAVLTAVAPVEIAAMALGAAPAAVAWAPAAALLVSAACRRSNVHEWWSTKEFQYRLSNVQVKNCRSMQKIMVQAKQYCQSASLFIPFIN